MANPFLVRYIQGHSLLSKYIFISKNNLSKGGKNEWDTFVVNA